MTNKTIKIGKKALGDGEPCYVIAEIGSNHNQDFELACRSIDTAAEAGVDAVKFQTFSAEKHYSKKTPGFNYLNKENTYELIKSLEINRKWHPHLKIHAEEQGVEFISSTCDPEAVEELRVLGMEAFKLASFDLPDFHLIKLMAKTGKPTILSTGMANWMDIQKGVDTCRSVDHHDIILLQCTSLYPAPADSE